MHLFSKLASLFLFIVFLSGCNDELNLVGERVDVPIVYGAISNADRFIFVRLERSFADNSVSPYVLAQDPDSIYFDDARVNISLANSTWNVDLIKTDATILGFPKSAGIFANTPNYVYAIDTSNFRFSYGGTYILKININEKEYTASTRLNPLIRFTNPQPLGFVRVIPDPLENESTMPSVTYTSINSNTTDTAVANLYARLNYRERNKGSNDQFENKSVVIPVLKNAEIGTSKRLRYSGNSFFLLLRDSLQSVTGKEREALNLDYIILRGGKEYVQYKEVIAAAAGITGSQDFPTFTNISNGALGLFTNKVRTEVKNFQLAPITLDSLKYSRYTSHLGFL